MHLGSPVNSPTRSRPNLHDRLVALHLEIELLQKECRTTTGMDAQAIADAMTRADRRITMVRYGVDMVRSEAKVVARLKKLAFKGKEVKA